MKLISLASLIPSEPLAYQNCFVVSYYRLAIAKLSPYVIKMFLYYVPTNQLILFIKIILIFFGNVIFCIRLWGTPRFVYGEVFVCV